MVRVRFCLVQLFFFFFEIIPDRIFIDRLKMEKLSLIWQKTPYISTFHDNLGFLILRYFIFMFVIRDSRYVILIFNFCYFLVRAVPRRVYQGRCTLRLYSSREPGSSSHCITLRVEIFVLFFSFSFWFFGDGGLVKVLYNFMRTWLLLYGWF